VKIGRRTAESLFAQHLFINSEVFGVFFELGQVTHQRQQIWNIGFDCFPDYQPCHTGTFANSIAQAHRSAQRSRYSITLPRKILSDD
jgi:hypothetical protein